MVLLSLDPGRGNGSIKKSGYRKIDMKENSFTRTSQLHNEQLNIQKVLNFKFVNVLGALNTRTILLY